MLQTAVLVNDHVDLILGATLTTIADIIADLSTGLVCFFVFFDEVPEPSGGKSSSKLCCSFTIIQQRFGVYRSWTRSALLKGTSQCFLVSSITVEPN
jgi:hypothetical protein